MLCWTVNAAWPAGVRSGGGRRGALLEVFSQHLRALHETIQPGVGRGGWTGGVGGAVNISVEGYIHELQGSLTSVPCTVCTVLYVKAIFPLHLHREFDYYTPMLRLNYFILDCNVLSSPPEGDNGKPT